jgi:hypothetical protein
MARTLLTAHAVMRRYVATHLAVAALALTLPTLAAAQDAGPDPSLAKPLSERLAAKLALSVGDSVGYSARYVFEFGGGRMKVVDDTFVLVAGDRSAPLDDAVTTVHAAIQSLWHDLSHRPTSAATVWVFASRKNYAKFVAEVAPKGARPSDLSFYVPESKIRPGTSDIFFCAEGQGLGGSGHEIAHHLVRYDFPKAPTWLAEGLPALLESAQPTPDGELHPQAHFRLQTLRTALTKPDYAPLVRLGVLFGLRDDAAFRRHEALSYALAREFLRWADSRHELWPFYRLFREGVLTDETGEKAFATVFGKTPADATDEFLDWIRSKEAE